MAAEICSRSAGKRFYVVEKNFLGGGKIVVTQICRMVESFLERCAALLIAST
jgi:hypothetical protein